MFITEQEIHTIYECDSSSREKQTVVSGMDGSLLISRSHFPYFALIAFDVGGILRLILLLLAAPLAALLHHFVSESAAIKVLMFVTFAGVKISAIKSAANAVLPKHYSEDLHPETWRVFSSCGRKCVLTPYPTIMVEPFLINYLGVDVVIGTEISSFKGFATGLAAGRGVIVGENKATALKKAFGNEETLDIGIGDGLTDLPFLQLFKERYVVPQRPDIQPVAKESLPKPVIFHDGRLVQKPTPVIVLVIILWFPIGLALCLVRVLMVSIVPLSMTCDILNLMGCPIKLKGTPPPHPKQSSDGRGVVYVCCHRTLFDPIVVSACLRRTTSTITYSLAGLSEFLCPIKSFRLTRNREEDAKLINGILKQGNEVVMFPEGTTCREPYLLRFSSLFAELTDQIVPVAVTLKTSMFYGNTVRGYKELDSFFLAMDPMPVYEVTFLDKLSEDETCKGGKSIHQVANNIQELIAKTLDYKCTNLTRKDKYRALAGTDGLV